MKQPEFQVPFDVNSYIILLVFGGSRAYGTNTEESDWDYKGTFIAPKTYYTSPFKTIEELTWKFEGERKQDKEEGTIYELKKFIQLACVANPNILEVLFGRDQDIIQISSEGQLLRDNRELFLTQKAAKAFTGYAYSQLHRVKGHRQWLLKGELTKPVRKEFGLTNSITFSESQWGALQNWVKLHMEEAAPYLIDSQNQDKELLYASLTNLLSILTTLPEYQPDLDSWQKLEEKYTWQVVEKIGLEANFVELIQKEKAYRRATQDYNSWLNWKATRNPERAALEAKFGFGSKHTMHLVRLLRTGYDLLSTGKLEIYRSDAEDLLAIRNGRYTYDELVEYAEKKTDEIYSLIRAGNCVLPKRPDQNKIEQLSIQLIESLWSRNVNS